MFLWGAPGIGKSSVVRQIGDAQKLPVTDIRAALLDPTDLRGIPAVVDGRAVWAPPGFLPHDPASKGILFFDELSAAPPLVQASLYQLTLDRRVGDYVLPDGWRIIAAGNRATDASISFRMPAALANRFVHLDFEVDFNDWRTWAVSYGIHPLVMAFLSLRRELLFQQPGSTLAFATPRSWEMVSDVLHEFGSIGKAEDILLGVIGEGPALEFINYAENALQEEEVRRILADPEHADLPEELGDLYALVSYVTAQAKDKAIRQAGGKLLPRLDPEFGVLLVRDLLSAAPSFISNKDCSRFLAEHKELIL
ncbi:AAA family ATPase [Gemmatimonadota bacterium]